jgi:hypothetical protein
MGKVGLIYSLNLFLTLVAYANPSKIFNYDLI